MIPKFLSHSFQIVTIEKNCRKEIFYAEKKKCFYLITEDLDLTQPTGFDLCLNCDVLRLDLHKNKKSDHEEIDEIYNKLKSELNKIGDLNLNANNESIITKPDNLQITEIENEEIIGNDDFIEGENLF